MLGARGIRYPSRPWCCGPCNRPIDRHGAVAETKLTDLVAPAGPDWVVAEMPPGYETQHSEIQRRITELYAMNQVARLLTELGARLAESVRDAFAAMKFETELVEGPAESLVAVRLDGNRRLLLIPSSSSGPVQKKGAELTEVFRVLQ